MFRTAPLSIIRSPPLYIQQWYMSYMFADSSQAVMKLYMSQTVPLSIIRSPPLYTQQWHMSYMFADSSQAVMKLHMFQAAPLSIIRRPHCTHSNGICHTCLLTARKLSWNSTCLGQFLCPSSGVPHCTHSNGICHTCLLTARKLSWNSTCLGQFLCPSSGVPDCTHSNGICHTCLLTAHKLSANLYDVYHCCANMYVADSSQAVSKPVWHIPLLCKHVCGWQLTSCQQTCTTYTIVVCTVGDSWRWTEELFETCRASFQE